MPLLREQLVGLLRSNALRKLDEPIKLASGAWSSDFIDGKAALAEWRDLRTASEAIVETVRSEGRGFDAVGGLTMGADALAVGIAAVCNSRWFFVRKEPKDRGTRRLIEGAQVRRGVRVLLVDDVVTTGGSILQALEIVRDTGAEVVAAATLVDRGDQARSQFEKLGVAYFPMATYELLGIAPVVHEPSALGP